MPNPKPSEIILYKSSDGLVKIDVVLEDETVWLTQEQMAELFGKSRTTIVEHIQNIFREGELDPEVVCRKFRHTTQYEIITLSDPCYQNRGTLYPAPKI